MYLPCQITVITQETHAISLECQEVSQVQPLSHSVHIVKRHLDHVPVS